jgi:alpha-methylacyl-CoA racemase
MGVLSGFKIVEFAAIGPVPWCARLLADMGAHIVRIDRPGSQAPSADSDFIRGGRTVVELNLKTPEGLSSALALVSKADAVIEGMRPGTMERSGLGPSDCMRLNPALVYGRMTGWGQEGPLATRAGHDINYIALAGVLHAIGPAERPAIPLNLVGDYGGGGAFLAIGLLAALLQARATGKGDVIDAAMVDGASFLMAPAYGRLASGQWIDQREQNFLDGSSPWYSVYETSDGKFVAVGAIEPQFYSELLAKLGIPEDSLPSRDNKSDWPHIRRRLAEVFRQQTRDEWTARLEQSDACVTPVLSMSEAQQHPHNRARRTFVAWEDQLVPAQAPRFASEAVSRQGRSQSATAADIVSEWSVSPGQP